MIDVAIDFDGTCCRTTDLVTALINWKRGTDYEASDVADWNWYETNDMEDLFWDTLNFIDDHDLRIAARPYDEDMPMTFLRLMRDEAFNIAVITRNPVEQQESIGQWFDKWVGKRPRLRVMGRGPHEEKLDLDFDVFVDDSPELWEAAKKRGDARPILLANAPWNEHIETKDRIRRWPQVYTRLLGMLP